MTKSMTVEEKLQKYEELLQEIIDSKEKKEGLVLAGPEDNLYKVKTSNGESIVSSPALKVKKGQSVVIIGGTIVRLLPESLISVNREDPPEFKKISWEEIGGMASQIETIRKKVEYPQIYKKIYAKFNMPASKGIILHGPPGCGKTLIAKAIASSMLKGKQITNDNFIYVKGAELLDMYVGNTEGRIKSMFDAARKSQKKSGERSIIFIDEAEAILPSRGSRKSSDVDTTIVPTFLSEMDGFQDDGPFVILATNYPEQIDVAVQRPGRIDLKIYVGRPTKEDSIEIFKIHLSKTFLHEDIEELAKNAATHLFTQEKHVSEVSGAMIANIVSEGIENALMRNINVSGSSTTGVTTTDLITAINHL